MMQLAIKINKMAWQIHHDNALVHFVQLVQQILAKHHILHGHQPLYSLDMTPRDFLLPPKI